MDKSTEEIRILRYQNPFEDNQNERTLSFPSSRSQDCREYLERNCLRFFENEDFQRPGVPQAQPKQPLKRYNWQDLAHGDCFYAEIDIMKIRINTLIQDSYDGKLKVAFQNFQKIEGKFREKMSQFGRDQADLCLQGGAICYRGHVDGEALEWLNKARNFSQRFEEKEMPEHFRRLYLFLTDVSIKREKWEDAEKYLKKAERIIQDNFENDVSYEGRRSLSWAQSLKGHLLSRDGKYEEAEKEYQRQLELKKTLNNGKLEALAYDYLVDFYIGHGQKDKAKPLLEKALEASQKFTDGYSTEARLLRNKARILFLEGEIEESKEIYIKAFEILARELPDGNTLEGQYQEEYKERFGVKYKGEEDGKVESWQATNSVEEGIQE